MIWGHPPPFPRKRVLTSYSYREYRKTGRGREPFRTGNGLGDPNHTTAHAETLVLCLQYSLYGAPSVWLLYSPLWLLKEPIYILKKFWLQFPNGLQHTVLLTADGRFSGNVLESYCWITSTFTIPCKFHSSIHKRFSGKGPFYLKTFYKDCFQQCSCNDRFSPLKNVDNFNTWRLGDIVTSALYGTALKPNSWTYSFVEVSGHTLESSQTWGFCIQCLHYNWWNSYKCTVWNCSEAEFMDIRFHWGFWA